jgi:hypothetical protein
MASPLTGMYIGGSLDRLDHAGGVFLEQRSRRLPGSSTNTIANRILRVNVMPTVAMSPSVLGHSWSSRLYLTVVISQEGMKKAKG